MSTATDELFDPGLQPERTLLAWRRTCLAFGVASLVGMRFTVDALGLLAVVGGILGAGLAVLAYALAATGYRRSHRALQGNGVLERSGLPMLLAAGAVLAIGALCALAMLAGLLG
ncbi:MULTISPECIES: DUF202 domain-containing protein [Brachybacterium]|uniref:DUF202 domain-containing protein n=1 Tax=Brachybacterium paraconglomeratum TaxID=173362 RepID=A0A921GPW1_9MICO|nr:DUF202 domain-containing protein [Brachybacterium paraconglomeratum]